MIRMRVRESYTACEEESNSMCEGEGVGATALQNEQGVDHPLVGVDARKGVWLYFVLCSTVVIIQEEESSKNEMHYNCSLTKPNLVTRYINIRLSHPKIDEGLAQGHVAIWDILP